MWSARNIGTSNPMSAKFGTALLAKCPTSPTWSRRATVSPIRDFEVGCHYSLLPDAELALAFGPGFDLSGFPITTDQISRLRGELPERLNLVVKMGTAAGTAWLTWIFILRRALRR